MDLRDLNSIQSPEMHYSISYLKLENQSNQPSQSENLKHSYLLHKLFLEDFVNTVAIDFMSYVTQCPIL